MVPLKKVRKDTSRPSDSTLRTLALTSIPGSRDPIVRPSHSCIKGAFRCIPRLGVKGHVTGLAAVYSALYLRKGKFCRNPLALICLSDVG